MQFFKTLDFFQSLKLILIIGLLLLPQETIAASTIPYDKPSTSDVFFHALNTQRYHDAAVVIDYQATIDNTINFEAFKWITATSGPFMRSAGSRLLKGYNNTRCVVAYRFRNKQYDATHHIYRLFEVSFNYAALQRINEYRITDVREMSHTEFRALQHNNQFIETSY